MSTRGLIRPVMTREELLALGKRILRMTTVDTVNVAVTHAARAVTRLANDRVLSSDDGDTLLIEIETGVGGQPPYFHVRTNQLDDSVLLNGVQQCEALLRQRPGYQQDTGMKHQPYAQDTPVAVQLWHDSTVGGMATARGTMIPEMLRAGRAAHVQVAGFVGLIARAKAIVCKDGDLMFYHDETDSEVNVVARSIAGKGIGWSGQSARDWSAINAGQVTQRAIDLAKQGMHPVAVEPGRRTAILMPAAIAPMLRYFAQQWDAMDTDTGRTALSKSPRGGNKLRQRIMDARLTMRSDPNDPEGGYPPYMALDQVATPPMTWVNQGVLTNMAYRALYAMARGKRYAEIPYSLRLSGGTTTVEQMIAQCEEGILVNRMSDVELIDDPTCLLTGVTHGGCFLIKDGKISKPVKNFRFLESPFFFLNKIEALGVPERASFGRTPIGHRERGGWDSYGVDWPRRPMIVPPMMVRDFNFNALSDAI
jgi:predicted Zn-dependent protease